MTQGAMGSVRRVRGVRGAAAVAVAAVLGGLAGCAEPVADPTPEPTETVETSEPEPEPEPEPTSEPEPEPEGLVRPDLMDENSDEGAIAAAEYITLLAYSLVVSGDLEAWAAVSGETCAFCDRAAAMIEETRANGHWYEGGAPELRGEAKIVGREEVLGVVGVDVPLAREALTKVDAEGAVLETLEAREYYFYVEVAHGHQGWVMISGHSHPEAY